MKTMISMDGKRIFRVTDDEASELYVGGEANYAPKSLWKEKVRDVNKKIDESPLGVGFKQKSNKMSKSAKRHMRKSK